MSGEGKFIDGLMLGDVNVGRNLDVKGAASVGGKLTEAPATLFESVAAVKTLVAADNGKTFFLNLAGGFTVTLPAPSLGLHFKFIVKVAPTTSYIIATAASANVIQGTIASGDLDAAADTGAAAASDTITFVANKAVIGDSVELVSDGTSWFARGFCKAFDALTYTQAT